jgi:hypothetical protein
MTVNRMTCKRAKFLFEKVAIKKHNQSINQSMMIEITDLTKITNLTMKTYLA